MRMPINFKTEVHENPLLEITTFIVSAIYSFLLITFDKGFDNFSTIFFCIYLLGINIYLIRSKSIFKFNISKLIYLLISINLGIFLGFACAKGGHTELWVIDSLSMHAPGAVNIYNLLNGTEALRELSSNFDRTYLTNVIVGFFFYILGPSPITSGIALMSIKCVAIFYLFKFCSQSFSKKTAQVACLFYICVPTIIFYNITYYKETTVHLLVILFHYLSSTYFRELKIRYLFLTLIPLALLSNERFYLAPIFGGTFLLQILVCKHTSYLIKASICTIFFAGISLFFYKYRTDIPIDRLISSIEQVRHNYNNYSDVNKSLNSELPFIFALAKFTLTPFFTFKKFEMFYNYSYLLIWGSFLNQLVITIFAFQVLRNIKIAFTKYWYIFLPLVFYFFLFAYIAPFSGRLRDVFYPMISIWSATLFSKDFLNENKA